MMAASRAPAHEAAVGPHSSASTGYELVAAFLFQDLNAQINALVADVDAVRARD
jgi:hypothetical protein